MRCTVALLAGVVKPPTVRQFIPQDQLYTEEDSRSPTQFQVCMPMPIPRLYVCRRVLTRLAAAVGGPRLRRHCSPTLRWPSSCVYWCPNVSQILGKVAVEKPSVYNVLQVGTISGAVAQRTHSITLPPVHPNFVATMVDLGRHALLHARLRVRNVVRPNSIRSCVPASRPATRSSCRPAGTPGPRQASLRARLRNHHGPADKKPLYLDPTTGHGRSISQ
jgi:hypothetical protein